MTSLLHEVTQMDGWRDHGLFYYAPRLFLHGQDAYDWNRMKAEWRNDGSPTGIDPGTTMSGFVTPPEMALLTAVPSLAPPEFGYRAIDLWNLIALAVCLFFLLKLAGDRWPVEAKLLFAAYVLTLPVVRSVLLLGQSTLLICACLAGGLYALSKRWEIPGGVAIGLAMSKFTLALPFVVLFAVRRRWIAVAVCVATILVANVLVALPGGIASTFKTYRTVVARERRPNSSYDPLNPDPKYMPDTMVHLERLLALMDPRNRRAVQWANAFLSLVIGTIMIFVLRPMRKSERKSAVLMAPSLETVLVTSAALILFYHRTYDLAALVLAGFALVDAGMERAARKSLIWKGLVGLILTLSYAESVYSLANPWLFHNKIRSLALCELNCIALIAIFALCAWKLGSERLAPSRTVDAHSPPQAL